MRSIVQRPPESFGHPRSRWTLGLIRASVNWFQSLTLSGVHGLMARLEVVYKRGRHYVHSPDPLYDQKMAEVARVRALVQAEPERFVMLYQDEVTYYRRPTVAQGYALQGSTLPLARLGYRKNLAERIVGSLNALTVQLFCWQQPHFGVSVLIRYCKAVQDQYPDAERIFMVQDNWPVAGSYPSKGAAGLVGT